MSLNQLFLRLFFLILLVVFWPVASAVDGPQLVRVGVYQNPPLLEIGDRHEVGGLFPRILRDIAKREGWQLEFVAGTWSENLARLEKGEIQLLPAIATTPERREKYLFTDQHILSNWGQIYVAEDSRIETLPDLDGKRIAVLRGDIFATSMEGIRGLCARFSLNCELLELGSYPEVMQAVDDARADAGLVNRLFGATAAAGFSARPSAIIMMPLDIRIAVSQAAKNGPSIKESLDRALVLLKDDPGSIYYRALDSVLESPRIIETLPPGTIWFGAVIAVVTLVLLVGGYIFRWQLRTRTKELADSERRLRGALEYARLGYWDLKSEAESAYWSDEVYQLLGIGPGTPGGLETLGKLVHEDDAPRVEGSLLNSLANGVEHHEEYRIRRPDGRLIWVECRGKPVFGKEGNVERLSGFIQEITTQKQQEEKIQYQAHFDALTDLPNRFVVLDRLAQRLKEVEREHTRVALLFLDLDDFKKVNDTLGHDAGDQVLVQMASRLRDGVRGEDTVGRLGGDEFIVVLGGLHQAAAARPVAETLLKALRKPFDLSGQEMVLTPSIGIAVSPDDGKDPAMLLRNADMAMYHAKQAGGNRYQYFKVEMNKDLERRLVIEAQLRGALKRGEFSLALQPIVELSSNRLAGAEAVLQWRNESLGDLSAEEYVPIAEHCGMMGQISEDLISRALAMLREWDEKSDVPLKILIRLTSRQLRHPRIPQFIEKQLQEHGVGADRLDLEITEAALMGGHAYVQDAMATLHSLGVGLVLGDFGTGNASLSSLRRFPFDRLKIDRAFVADIGAHHSHGELVSASIAMAHALGLRVIAEGVESTQQLVFLQQRQCDYAQGSQVGSMMSPEAFFGLVDQLPAPALSVPTEADSSAPAVEPDDDNSSVIERAFQ